MSSTNRSNQLIADHQLPTLDKKIIRMSHQMGTGDWWAKTDEGWFYCRTQDVEPKRRKWQPSVYGPPGEQE